MKNTYKNYKNIILRNLGILIITIFLFSCGMNKEETHKLYDKALQEFYAGKYKETIEILDKLIKVDPKRSELYFYRGSSFFNLKNANKALDDFNTAITIKPDYADAYATRGDIYSYFGKKDEACKDYKEAEKLGKPNMRDKVKYCP